MKLLFYKYQGTGNDFILADNRDGRLSLTTSQIERLCHRNFGIGADGFILLDTAENSDFRMVYFNADGKESTMCGNGGRCATAFAKHLGIIGEKATFLAADGLHQAVYHSSGSVSLQMKDVAHITRKEQYTLLDTGSPHYVRQTSEIHTLDVNTEGKKIRNAPEFIKEGINVNFSADTEDGIYVRTYERGVEAETLSCGTGATAAAIAKTAAGTGDFDIRVQMPGGFLKVSFQKDTPDSAKNIWLTGDAVLVFEGAISLNL